MQDEAHGPLGHHAAGGVVAVDVVHPAAGAVGQHLLHKVFGGAHGQRLGGGVKTDGGFPAVRRGQGEALAALRRLAQVQAQMALLAVGVQLAQHLVGAHIKQHPGNGLDLDGIAVQVAHLGQAPAGGMGLPLLGGQGGLQLLPIGLGGGQAVVAVAHGQGDGRLAGGGGEFLIEGLLTAQGLDGIGQCAAQGLVLHGPAPDGAAAQHQLTVVQRAQPVLLCGQAAQNVVVPVVDEHHHMGQLQAGAAAHRQPGGNALHHRVLGGTHRRAAAGGVAVLLQIHRAQQAGAHRAAAGVPLHIHNALHGAVQHRTPVFLHVGLDGRDALGLAGLAQIHLGQHQMQGAGLALRQGLSLLPVFGLAGKLVAGQAGPLTQGNVLVRQQNVGRYKAIWHGKFLLFSFRSLPE